MKTQTKKIIKETPKPKPSSKKINYVKIDKEDYQLIYKNIGL